MASSFLQQRIKERDQRRSGDVSADNNAPSAFLQQRIEERDRRRATGEGYRAPVQRITFPEKKEQTDTQAQQEAYIKEYQRQTGSKTEDKFNGWKYSRNLGQTFLNGIASLAASGAWVEDRITDVVDFIFQGAGTHGSGLFNALYNGRPDWKVFGENGLVGIRQEQEALAQERAEEIAKIKTGNETADTVLKGAASFGGDTAAALGGALPMAAEAAVTGGASMTDDLFRAGANVVGKTGILETIGAPLKKTLTSREYWTAFATEVGQDYQEALADGASEEEASNYAVVTALLNSVIEIGGGIQNAPDSFSVKSLLRSAAEEGMEEVEQGPVGRLMKNVVYGKDAPLFSTTDEDAVLNPRTAAQEFAGGFAVGGIMNGGQALARSAMNRAYQTQYEKTVQRAREKAGIKGEYQASQDGKTTYNGQEVSIDGVDKDGKLRLSTGESVAARDVRFADQNTAEVYEGLVNSDLPAAVQGSIAKAYERGDGYRYVLGAQEAYRAGQYGTDMSKGGFNTELTETQRKLAYDLGVAMHQENNEKAAPVKGGKVVYEKGIDQNSFTPIQRTSVKLAEAITKVVNGEVHLYSTTQDAEGKRTIDQKDVAALLGSAENAPNGFYDHKTGNIYVDINAGSNGEGTILYTLGHEYTHLIHQNARESFDKLAEYLFSQYGEQGVDVDALVLAKREALGVDYETAYEEVVADSMETMLTDTNAAEKIAALKKTDKTLWEKLKDLVSKLLESVRGLYQNMTPNSEEGRKVQQMTDALDRLSDLFVEGLSNVQTVAETGEGVSRQARVGTDSETGKPVYESNFPKGTPKAAKAQHILSLIQNVWSKKPIPLTVRNEDGSTRTIKAQFDPTYDAESGTRSDASKLMGGNRHGSAAEQRVTLDLADDYYEIAAESTFNYSKKETGKSSVTHRGVNQWHYFINDILFQEYGEKETTPYRVTINVKERSDGEYVYSFSAERQNERPSTRRTLHADVTPSAESGKSNAQPFNTIIPTSDEKSNTKISKQERGTSDREILTTTAESSAKTSRERELLAEYKSKVERLEGYESRLSANRAELTELSLSDGKKNAKRIAQLKTEISQDTNRVALVENQLKELESRGSLQDLLGREKDAIRVQQAERMQELEERLNEYRKKYGVFPGGEKAARAIQLPKKSSENEKISQTVRTILEAKATPEEMVPDIETLALDGKYSYETYSDKAAIADADGEIKRVGWAQALTDWKKALKSGSVSKKNTAMGWALYNNAANSGDTDTALNVLSDMVQHQRNAAQALQATRILKQLSPETQLYQAQRSIENLQTELNKEFGDGKAPELKIDQKLAEQFMQAADQAERDAVLANIYRDIGKQMPSRFKDKWNAWRYLAMLGNVRTHVRNVVGNAGFVPVVAAKDVVATGIEKAVYRLSGGKMQRSKEFVFGKGGKALLRAAAQDYAKVADVAMGGGKYSDLASANKYIEEGRVIFQSNVPGLKQVSKGLEAARKANSTALDAEDAWFSKPHYAYAMAQYCKANGITAEMIAKGGDKVVKAREYAIREAQKATYRDTNAFSQAISELGRMGKTGGNSTKKAISTVMEGILPFRKTPANILVRGVEYSPIGLLNGIKEAAFDVRNGTKTAAEAIDSISAGLTGTGLLLLGGFLAAQGLVRGHGDDDDKKNDFMELAGHQAYALELPNGTSITLDWLAPECLPFFVGVNLWELSDSGKEAATMADWLTAVSQVSEPMLEMSCLQSLNDVFDAVGYASSNGLAALPTALANAATSYVTQGLPTILGQAERTGEGIRYTTYTDKNSKLTTDMQYAVGRASAKLPGWDYSQIPYIDAWGRTETTGDMGTRAFNNFLNPAYTSTVDMSEMEQELLRLYETTGESVLPRRASKYFNADKKRIDLTGEQYVTYAQKKGGEAYKWLTELTRNAAYRNMTDEQKADCIGYIYSAANEVAKAEVVSSYEPTKWVREALKSGGVVNAAITKAKGK